MSLVAFGAAFPIVLKWATSLVSLAQVTIQGLFVEVSTELGEDVEALHCVE